MITTDTLHLLRRPFPKDAHTSNYDGFIYIDETAVSERLDEVDPGWSLEILSIVSRDQKVAVHARLIVMGTARDGIGMQTVEYVKGTDKEISEPEKGAATDALRRCARLFGIGRYLLGAPKAKGSKDWKQGGEWTDFNNWYDKSFGKQPAPRPTTPSPAPSAPKDAFAEQFPAAGKWTPDQLYPLVDHLYGKVKKYFDASMNTHAADLSKLTLEEAVAYLKFLHWNMDKPTIEEFKQQALETFGLQGAELAQSLAHAQSQPFATWKDWQGGDYLHAHAALLAYAGGYSEKNIQDIAKLKQADQRVVILANELVTAYNERKAAAS